MELVQELLDEKNEKILSKLDGTIGISQNKEILRDIVRYSQVIKKYDCNIEFENYNIVIRNQSTYELYKDLINVIAEIYYKNKIITNSDILYLDRNDYKDNKIKKEDIKEGVIVIDLSSPRGSNAEIRKLVKNMIEKMPKKVFIVLENSFLEGEINAVLNEYFSWSMKIDVISNEEKERYIKKFMETNNLTCNNDIIKEIADKPYYKIKNEVINILVNCRMANENNVDNVLKKEKKTNKKVSKVKSTAIDELEDLTGLEDVKEQVRKVVNFAKLSKDRNNLPMLHMCFNGNPGTGKTTIARIVGEIFAEEKILSDNKKFVEIHGRDLVGKFVGWTAGQTKQKIKEAEGGVLFIDEAYSLISDRRGGYEEEAIATLLKEMEDKRDKVCVIMAGYDNKMKELLEMNPGFESRIQFKIQFPDYSSEELYDIFKNMCKKEDYKISSSIKKELLNHFEIAKQGVNFSNARYVRSLFEKSKMEQANRVVKNEDNKNLIRKCDVLAVLEGIELKSKKIKSVIGFCA